MNFENIRIVMVETSHAGNIGAAARAMKTMFLSNLALVKPRNFPSDEATARASGAGDLLEAAMVVESVEEAIAGCDLVIGASARVRTLDWPQLDGRACAELVQGRSQQGKVAILFGREDSGLTNEEMAYCHYLLHFPTNPDYSSLNVAAAVQIICYELMMQGRLNEEQQQEKRDPLSEYAASEELEGMFNHMEEALKEIEFLQPENPRQMMLRLRRLFNRAQLEVREVNILRGIFKAAQRARQAR